MARITFGEWLPDQPGVIGALTNARNVVPKAVGYGPFPQEVNYSENASENLVSVYADKDDSGNVRVFGAGATKLFLLDSTDYSLNDVSGTTYSQVEKWRFSKFGSIILAAGEGNTLQSFNLNSSVTFADAGTAAPKAKFVSVVRDFVVTGNQIDHPARVQWSAINDETDWTPSQVTQSDFQDLPDGGEIRGVTGGEFGLVLMERSIYRMSYVGTPFIFQFDNIARNRGCYAPNSVIQYQGITYFMSDDGFYACDGQNVLAIGAEKVNRFFIADLLEDELENISTAVDALRDLIMWGYRSKLQNTYRIIMYHLPTKRWAYANTNATRLGDISSPGTTLEGLDSFGTIDSIITPFDSRQWTGGKFLLAGARDARIITFSGPPKTATIDTSDIETEGQKTMVTMIMPIVDGGQASVAVDSRQVLDEVSDFTDNPLIPADSENRIGTRSLGRYHRFRVQPSGDNWSTAIGLDIKIRNAGER
jgi:hypothetical protein